MTTETITQLPLAISISGSESIEIVQGGTSKQTTTGAIAGLAAAAGTVTQINTNAPLNGGPITTTGTISLQSGGVTNQYLANMPTLTVKANITGGTAQPTDVTAAAFISAFGVGTVTSVGAGAGLTGGPITTTGTLSLTTTGVTAGTYGSTTAVGRFTVDNYGRISSATNQTINIPAGQVSGLGTMATQNANSVAITGGTVNGTIIGGSTPSIATFTTLTATGSSNFSTIASGTWNGTAIGIGYGGTGATTAPNARTNLGAAASGANSDITSLSGLTTPLSAPQGGTGFGSYTTGDILYANTSSTLARLNDVATGNALISGGVGVAPSWGKIGLTTHVSGTLPVANGGTGATTLTGFLKGNGTSPFTAQATINNADLTNSSVTIGSTTISLGGTTSTISGLTTLTLTQDPTSALQASTKQYVDGQVQAVSNTTFHTAVYVATTADLGTVTYNNGTGGVGATITNAGAQAALTIDGYTFQASDVTNATRVLVKDQTSGLQNGIYIVTNQGSGSTNWQLQRSSDFNTTGTGPNYIQTGAGVFITSGTTWGSTSWVMNTTGTINVGSTALNWVQTSSAGNFSVTAPLQKTGNVISLNTVGVAYGGTGLTSLTQYQLLYAPTTSSVGQIASGTSGYPLLSGGAGAAPAFNQLSLSGTGITGTLGVTNGGTGTSTQFTAGSVVFAGTSGVYSQNNADLFWDNTNIRLGINTPAPNTTLTILSNSQTATPPTAGSLPAGTDLYILGANAANTRITQDAYGTGNYPAYTGRQARGTAALPTASQTGDILAQYTGRGYGATAFASNSNARIDMEAAENFTDTAQGTYISIHTTSLGAASPTEKFRVGPSGQWGIGGATYGTSGYAFVSGGASAAPSWSQISLTAGVTGTLPATNGGTGQSTYTIGDLLYASSSSALSKLAAVATGNVLLSAGVGTAPAWGQVNLASMVTGTLPVSNGGTGQASALTQYGVVYGSTTAAMATTTAGTTGQILVANTGGAPTWSSTIPSTAGVTSITGGTNITASASTGAVTISTTANPTFATSVTSPLHIGGTTASSTLTLQSTSGVGTSDAISFKVGNNGATTAMYINTSGNVGIGTSSPLFTAGGGVMVLNATQANYRLADGTNYVDLVQNSGAGYLWNRAANFLSFGTSNTERMRIDSSGNVGIGTSSPTSYGAPLAVYAAANPSIAIASGNANAYLRLYSTSDNNMYLTNTGGSMTMITASTEKMRIDSSGNVGIGTTSPAYLLDVVPPSATATNGAIVGNTSRAAGVGTDYRNGWFLRRRDNTNPTSYGIWTSSDTTGANYWENMILGAQGGGASIVFQTGSLSLSEAMRINNAGNVGIGITSPRNLEIARSDANTSYGAAAAQFPLNLRNTDTTANNWAMIGINQGPSSLSNPVSFGAQLSSTTAGSFVVATSGSERMRITSTGAISVGSSGTATGTSGQVLTSAGSGSAPTWTTISTEVTTAPTTTVYTTGSGTYTTPANVKYLYIRMVGGGAGSGGQAGSTGTGGGNTTFGTSFLTANGGSAPAANAGGAAGGTATGGDINIQGGVGGPRCFNAPQAGSNGGHTMLGNGGQGGENNGGGGYSGTGYGAGGGSYGPSSGQNSGGGGGAGGYLEKIVSSPAATYSYAVGAGGSAGTNSGQGTGGIIIIQEYYNY